MKIKEFLLAKCTVYSLAIAFFQCLYYSSSVAVPNPSLDGRANAGIPVDGAQKRVDLDVYSVDFDTSMGKYDRYLKNFYQQALKNMPTWWSRGISNANPQELNTFFTRVYDQNKLNKLEFSSVPRIPKIFHQIWVGKKPFPEDYKKWQESWQHVPGWEYKLWTDKEVETLPLTNRDLYEQEKSMGARADILRVEILYREGGVYVDTDFECLKPEMFDVLNCNYDFYAGITPVDAKVLLLNNALIGSVQGHPILKGCIDSLKHIRRGPGFMDVVARGPALFTSMAYKFGGHECRDIFFPPTVFYPLLISSRTKPQFVKLGTKSADLEAIKKQIMRPESVAVHYWEGAWTVPDAFSK